MRKPSLTNTFYNLSSIRKKVENPFSRFFSLINPRKLQWVRYANAYTARKNLQFYPVSGQILNQNKTHNSNVARELGVVAHYTDTCRVSTLFWANPPHVVIIDWVIFSEAFLSSRLYQHAWRFFYSNQNYKIYLSLSLSLSLSLYLSIYLSIS